MGGQSIKALRLSLMIIYHNKKRVTKPTSCNPFVRILYPYLFMIIPLAWMPFYLSASWYQLP